MTSKVWQAASVLVAGAVALSAGCKDSGSGGTNDETGGVDPTKPGDDDDDGGPSTGGDDTTSSTTGGDPVSTTQSIDDNGDEPIPDPPVVFDLGGLPDAPNAPKQCQKVDFMFVIDNSGSMGTYQTNLVNNFPNFIAGIQDSLEEVESYQVGVISTDSYTPNKPGCNTPLSGLVVQTGGSQSSNAVCATGPGTTYADGFNFMTENDDLPTTFSCAARIGTSGSGLERPMQAVVEATQKVAGGVGQCNEGFIRDDALLVIVVITDEWDGPGDPEGSGSIGSPQTWYDDVVAAKFGIPENIVAVVLTNYVGGMCQPPSQTENGQNLVEWAQMFGETGFVGGICENYATIFQEAIAVIDSACEGFIPPQ